MKWKELRDLLNENFGDDDVIYPHAGMSCVTFYRIDHGQHYVRVEPADLGFPKDYSFEEVSKRYKTENGQ